jgi:DNA segregation ATPase FtsK/SpoIIIE, S-DNA-T family
VKRNKGSRRNKAREVLSSAGFKAALLCLATGLCFVLLFSCLSFNIGDWPSQYVYPNNKPLVNWCGSMGAFLAFYLLYYFGPGVFIVLVSTISYCIAKLARRPVDQPIFRLIGLVLLTAAASATFYSFWPHKLFTFPMGSGGVLGISTSAFLKGNFARLGAFILTCAIWFVGLSLLADSVIVGLFAAWGVMARRIAGIVVPAWAVAKEHSEALTDIWQRLSARQKVATPAPAWKTEHPVVVTLPEAEPASKPQEPPQGMPEAVPAVEAPAPKKPEVVEVKRPPAKPEKPEYVPPSYDDYTLPPLDLLAEGEYGYAALQEKVVKSKAAELPAAG